jgi:hypothetical protein
VLVFKTVVQDITILLVVEVEEMYELLVQQVLVEKVVVEMVVLIQVQVQEMV